MSVQSFTKSGLKSPKQASLPKDIFDVSVDNHDLLHQAYKAGHSNTRVVTANVKDRGEVRGGGAKPWRQKGTGRARHGSIRSPIWRGGGVTFGPSLNRNYTKDLPKAALRKSVRQALTLATKSGKVSLIDDFVIKDSKSSSAQNILQKIAINKPILIAVDKKDESTMRAVANIPGIKIVSAKYLSAFSILNAKSILITSAALKSIEEWLSPKKSGAIK